MGLVPSKGATQRVPLPILHVRAKWERGSRPSPDIKFAGTLILDFAASRSMRNKCLLVKPPVYGFLFLFSLWLCWVFVAVRAFLQLRPAGLPSGCSAWASPCGGSSRCGAQSLGHLLSGCGAWASLLCGLWNLPRPAIEPMSPTLAGEFFTTEPPGKLPNP